MIDRKSAKKDVHVFYKKLGETPLECILRFKKENPEYEKEAMTYAGRLDPMAEGLMVLLSGEEVNNKDKYTGMDKEYEFDVLWGFNTDTLDLLGGVVDSGQDVVLVEDLDKYLERSKGKFEQVYPVFSSKTVDGIPLWQWAREGKISLIEIPKHTVEIFDAKHISRTEMTGEDLIKEIERRIKLVSGDFRQDEILKKWQDVLEGVGDKTFVLDSFSIKVSSGFYVRQFVSDMAKAFGVVATTFYIKRTRVGDFE
ncbi:MAG: hypothetical protein ABL899_01535 [Nitrospira sp.]